MEVQKVLTENAVLSNPTMDVVDGKVVLQMENKNGVPKIESDTHVAGVYRRYGFEPAEAATFGKHNDYVYDQVVMPPVEYPADDWSGKQLFDAARAGYNYSISTKGKLPLNIVQVGQYSFAFRHNSKGAVGYGGALPPYGATGSIALIGGAVLYTNGTIPLVVGADAKALPPLKPLSDEISRRDTYLNLTDGASVDIELVAPMALERIYIQAESTRGGFDAIVLDVLITKADGTTVNRKMSRYNYIFYGQQAFGDLGAISKVTLTFKASDQVKGFKARNYLKDSKLLNPSLLPAGEGTPVTPISYIQVFALNAYKGYGFSSSSLVDITSQYKVKGGTQPAAATGTSVHNLLDPASTTGWTAANVNQAANTFLFELIDPLAQVIPKEIVLEFVQNEAYKGVTQIAVTTSTSNMGDSGVASNTTQRYTLDPAYAPVAGETAPVRIEIFPNQNQPSSNTLNVIVTEGNATQAMSIKSIKVYAL